MKVEQRPCRIWLKIIYWQHDEIPALHRIGEL
jgi:hypothetical protein